MSQDTAPEPELGELSEARVTEEIEAILERLRWQIPEAVRLTKPGVSEKRRIAWANWIVEFIRLISIEEIQDVVDLFILGLKHLKTGDDVELLKRALPWQVVVK